MLEQIHLDSRKTSPTGGTAILLVITAAVLYLCWTMVAPFVSVLTWAVALAIATNPIRRWLQGRIPMTAIALLIVSLVFVVAAVLMGFVSHRLVRELIRARDALQALLQPAAWQQFVASRQWLADAWSWIASRVDVAQFAQDLTSTAAQRIAPAVGKSALVLSRGALSLLFLFFFVRDQELLLDAFRRLLPLNAAETAALFERVSNAIRASVYGRVIIGAIQGLAGGLIFWAVGLPAPLFWGIVMGALSVLPVVGAFLVWIPGAAILLLGGHWIRALIVVASGIAIIHPIDNVLYPVMVGPRMGLHPVVLLVAFLGGMMVFGVAGLILGPVIVATAFALGEIWSQRAAI